MLRYYLGLDVREIAEQLGIAAGTVKAMLFRARQALAISLGEDHLREDTRREDTTGDTGRAR